MDRRLLVLTALSAIAAGAGAASCGSNGSQGPAASEAGAADLDGTVDAPLADVARDGNLGDASAGADGNADAGDALRPDDLGVLGPFCANLAKATCDRQAYCSGHPDPACEPQYIQQCHMYARAQLVEAIGAGLVSYDPAKAAACFATPMQEFCPTNDLFGLAECTGIFTGTVPAGGACFGGYFFGAFDECATGACSRGEEFGFCVPPGRCRPWFEAGAPCADDAGMTVAPGCAPGTQCVGNACAPAKPGDPCTNLGSPCRNIYPRLACVPPEDGGAGSICDFARDTGSNCSAGGIDFSIACRSLLCNNGRCTDRTPDGGIPCMSLDPPCPAGTFCAASSGSSPPTCQPARAAGASCLSGETCVAGYSCVLHAGAGSCDPLPSAGMPCSGPGRCAAGLACSSRFSDAGATCQPVVAAGGTCRGTLDDTCGPGLLCLTATKTCAPPVAFAGACVVDSDCEPGLYCDVATRTCRTWKRNGVVCAGNNECVYAESCEAGVCNSVCVVP